MKELFDRFNKDKYIHVGNDKTYDLVYEKLQQEYDIGRLSQISIYNEKYIYDGYYFVVLFSGNVFDNQTVSYIESVIKYIKKKELIKNRIKVIDNIL